MPIYEFEIRAGEAGAVVAVIALPLSVAERDEVTLTRRSVPTSVGISGAAADPGAPERQVLHAYRRLEQRIGNNAEFHRRIGHTPAEVKTAWAH